MLNESLNDLLDPVPMNPPPPFFFIGIASCGIHPIL